MTHDQCEWIWQHNEWPDFTWQAASFAPILREINQLQGRLLGSRAAVDTTDNMTTELDALLQNAINTAAIEGEQLDVGSIRSSLARRLGMDRSGLLAGTPQTEGLAEVLMDATRNPNLPLTLERLFQWHRALFPDEPRILTTIRVGAFREVDPMQVVSGPVGRQRIHFEAPPCAVLKQEMKSFIDWFNQSNDDKVYDPILRAGVAHLWFVTLHPFDDGNGRLARAITDLALAQAEHQSVRLYAMAATIMENRKAYYAILEKTQRNGLDITPWLEWFLTMLKQTLVVAAKRIGFVVLKARFWQQHAQSVLNERQVKVLNKLLDAGPEGFEGGLNATKYISMADVSKATATRDLTELVEKGCLIQRAGGGRSTSYDISWP